MKSKYLIVIIVGVAVFMGTVYLVSKNSKAPAPTTSSQALEETVSENYTYGHIHALFKIASTGAILLGTHNGLFKSADQGKTFVDAKPEIDGEFMNFAYDAENNIIYAGGHGLGVVKSTDNGATWIRTDSGIKGDDIHALALNSLNPNLVYAFSVNQGVFGTKDGAKSWYRIDDGPSNPSTRSFAYMTALSPMDRSMMKNDSRADIGYLWAGTGGGLYSSFACFCGWTKDNAFPDTATIYAIAPDPSNRPTMLIGTKDGIYRTNDEGKTFKLTSGDIKDVSAIWFNIQNPKLVLATTNAGIIYSSEDSGLSWKKS